MPFLCSDTPSLQYHFSISNPKGTKDSNKQGFDVTICRGGEGDRGIFNYLALCRINEHHYQFLSEHFLQSKREINVICNIYVVLVLDKCK